MVTGNELKPNRRITGRWFYVPIFWNIRDLQLDAGYQGEIPNTAEFDLVICILWSRLGACWPRP